MKKENRAHPNTRQPRYRKDGIATTGRNEWATRTLIRVIFNALSPEEAQGLLTAAAEKYSKTPSKLAAWREENIPEELAVLSKISGEGVENRKNLSQHGGYTRMTRLHEFTDKSLALPPVSSG